MLILADNDVGGAVTLLRRILESEEWGEYSALLELRFVGLAELGLARDASDRTVWQTCQAAGAVLVTGNRAGGPDSLDQTIRQLAGPTRLPVVTLADPQRLQRDRAYAEASALRLLDFLERIDALRGTGRLFVP